MTKPKLTDVTLIIVDCVNYERARKVFEHSLSQFDFGAAFFLTDEPKNPGDVGIEKIKSLKEYSKFMVKNLTDYFQTSHCLVIQWDGFIINPQSWDAEFLKYDYIGAPWPSYLLDKGKDYNVGNGGFSLRSKKLQDLLKALPYEVTEPEDAYICKFYRKELEENGMVFAPTEVASKFSVESGKIQDQFGQHGRPFGSKISSPKISTLINYCTNDYKFIGACIRSVQEISEEVVVSYCSHFLNGDPEDRELIEKTIAENPQAKFVEFPYSPHRYSKTTFWHNRGRAEAYQALENKNVDWLLVLDADEVADPIFNETVSSLLENSKYDAMRILSYWYYRDLCWQAQQHEDSALLLRNGPHVDFGFFLNCPSERLSLMKNKAAHGFHINWLGTKYPLFHHYSWARTKEEMHRKIKGWAHLGDKGRDWPGMIEKEFSREFDENCRDYVHGYTYKKVEPVPYFKS
jgi:hypothetical protein